jgi:DNA-binding transcriptional ArsR family regulator
MHDESFFKAFGNKERVQLMVCLASPKYVTELLDRCTLSQSALSQHLKVLKDAGLVKSERSGRHISYVLTSKKVLTVARALLEQYTHKLH